MTVIEIIAQLEATSSKNEKLAILKANQNNAELKEFFRLALDPFTNFYIRKIPTFQPKKIPEFSLMDAMGSLRELSSRIYTGNEAKKYLGLLLYRSGEHARIIERIIAKDPKCGVQTSTVNKVWPGLIFEYPVMLASSYDQKLIDKIKWPWWAQIKMDGMRFNAIVKDGKVEYYARSGKSLELLGSLDASFLGLASALRIENVVFDGELLVRDNQGNLLTRKEGNGILNKANKGTISQSEADRVCATLWDVIPYERFLEGFDPTPYRERLDLLFSVIRDPRITPIHTIEVGSLQDAQNAFAQALEMGEEGIILKDPFMPWESGRSKKQIKFKAEKECDLEIVGWNEGAKGTKNEGILGALVCQSSDGKLVVNVGSGITDQQRKEWKPEDVIGKVAAVLYNEKITDVNGNHSLFLPRLIEVRFDKTEGDSFEQIK